MNKEELAAARNSPENRKRLAELKALEESENAKNFAASKLFDPIALLSRTSEIHEVTHPQLGIIRFGELVLSDSEIISKCKEKNDRSAMALYLMLKKAYPEMPQYTPETIQGFYSSLPMVEGTQLLQFFLSQPGFLGEKLANGSEQTQAPTN